MYAKGDGKMAKSKAQLTLVKDSPKVKSLRLLSEEAKEKVVVRSRQKARKLARSILRRWNARLDLSEVDSIVDLSLCEAAARFSPEMGASFMTFLFYHLRGNLIRTISTAVNTNVVPLHDSDGMLDEEVAHSVVQSYEVANALTGTEVTRPDEILIKEEMLKLSSSARDKLDTLAQQVLQRIFVNEEQLIDIAYDLGYSRCHISRVKRRALETVYTDIAASLDLDAGYRPNFDDEDAKVRSRLKREIHRRKPRSLAVVGTKRKVA